MRKAHIATYVATGALVVLSAAHVAHSVKPAPTPVKATVATPQATPRPTATPSATPTPRVTPKSPLRYPNKP